MIEQQETKVGGWITWTELVQLNFKFKFGKRNLGKVRKRRIP